MLALMLVLIVPYWGQLTNAAGVLQRGQWAWLAAAVGAQLAWQVAQAAQFRAAFQLVGVPQSLPALLPVVMANNCINLIAPSGSASSFALFAADARRRRLPPARVVPGVMLFAVLEYVALGVLSGCGVWLLHQRQALSWLHLLPALLMIGLALVLLGTLSLGSYSAVRLARWMAWGAQGLNRAGLRLWRRELFPAARVERFLGGLTESWAELGRSGWRLRGLALGLALSAKAVWLAVLYLVAQAFQLELSTGDLVIGVSVAALFTVVSPTPQGIGIAEGALALTLAALGVPWDQAVVVGLAYRGLTLWLPVVSGFGWLHWWGRRWAGAAG